MPDSTQTTIERRLAAVERAVADDVLAAAENANEETDGRTPGERLDATDDRIDALERRVRELEAATEAMRGYVGAVRAVNQRVERRADAALAAVASLDPDRKNAADPAAVLTPSDPADDLDATDTGDPSGATDTTGAGDDTATAWWEEPTDCPRLREREP